ncbi:MAG: hypothetical protein HKO66_14230 [Saprospiraceae bacterium]|nr:tail fiber protein [Bacteroidia bacterium]NNE13836.1 hypothetical protein [Saprospiraceae bacterium]NNL93395.1 hypothetical protein [Saprospiraceae bacterium]
MNEATNKTLTATVKSFESGTEPDGWLKCEGQMVYIGDQTALFSLLGTNYGGDGRASFGMPDLRNEDGDYFIYTLAFFQD